MKLKEKIEAIHLRRLGKSYSEIRKQLNVSKSALSLWLRSVKLIPAQLERLKGRQRSGLGGGKANREKRIRRTKEVIKEAKKEAGQFFKTPLFLSGLMLYWAEGDKSDEREVVKFTNSDPAMIKFIMRWFREVCKVPEKKFRIALHIHKLHCRKDVEEYWSKLTNIPSIQFYKIQIKPTSLRYRRNRLYNEIGRASCRE